MFSRLLIINKCSQNSSELITLYDWLSMPFRTFEPPHEKTKSKISSLLPSSVLVLAVLDLLGFSHEAALLVLLNDIMCYVSPKNKDHETSD